MLKYIEILPDSLMIIMYHKLHTYVYLCRSFGAYHHYSLIFFHQQTPLHIAAARDKGIHVVEFLVGAKADVNITDSDGVSIQHYTTEDSLS